MGTALWFVGMAAAVVLVMALTEWLSRLLGVRRREARSLGQRLNEAEIQILNNQHNG